MKNLSCVPRCGSNNNKNTNRLSRPTSLLERFQQPIFRLFMLTSLQKATRQRGPVNAASAYKQTDSNHTEGITECIQFMKKSASVNSICESTAIISVAVV
ncbi:hypothetical protein IFM89_014762 [Coptis chinensis]|uniref:Uncharacterized protein n=1 Tax=Coptis chinensis TaxID=261450 RepID=A0A835IKU6_9MAGN|nr:hypothetical protein IFM89_014762 [Coptis chinensis]